MTMVAAVLIATMAFQAAVSPPGGVWQEDGFDKETSRDYKAGSVVVGYCPLVSLFAADVAAADSDSSPVSTTDARRCCVVAAVQSKVLQCRRHHRAAAAGVALCHRLPAVSPSLSRSALAAHCCCCSEPGDAAVARPDSPYRVGAHAGASACRLAAARRRQLLCRRFAIDPSGSFSVIAAGRCRCSRCSVAAGRRCRSPILRRTPRGVTAVRKQNSLLLSTPRPRCAIAVGVPLSKGLKSSSHQPLPHSFLPSPLDERCHRCSARCCTLLLLLAAAQSRETLLSVVVGYCPLVSLFAADVAAADSDSSPVSTTDARRCCVVAAVQSKVLQCRRHHRAAAAGVALCHRLPAVSPSLSRSALAAHCCCCSEPGDAAVARPDSPYRVGAHAGASACRLAAARRRQLLCRRFAIDPSGSFSVIAAGRCRCSRCSVAAGRRCRSPILRRTPRGVTAVRKQNSLLLSTPRPRCAIAVGVPLSKGLKSSSHQPLPHSFLPSPLGFLLSKLDV
ncbi:hypothetical protein SASPL_106863 [Salvia splendens]|uniref:PGG domain-containing protein n=1 Tax=Salvia splendens TaxID=180675 RepID=A0A8X8YA13_SALSN|nr:hypothetical protein SASPL_106863 [Salvia splendens]